MPASKPYPAPSTHVSSKDKPDLLRILLELGPGEARVRESLRMVAVRESEPEASTWMTGILPHLTFHSSTPKTPTQHATVTFRFEVKQTHSNGLGNMHGGCTSTLFDFCTSTVLGMVNAPGYWLLLGVSRTLSVSYLLPVPVGETVLVESELVQVGRRLAHIKGRIRREVDGVVLATCEHDKVNTDAPVSKV